MAHLPRPPRDDSLPRLSGYDRSVIEELDLEAIGTALDARGGSHRHRSFCHCFIRQRADSDVGTGRCHAERRTWVAHSRPFPSSAGPRGSRPRGTTATSTSTASSCRSAHSFDPIEGGFLSGVAPYAEITLGYLTGSQTFPLTSDGNSPTSVKLSFNAWSALAGGGIDVPLGNGFKVRPIVLAGYSYVGGDATFYGPNSVLARSQVSGILSDASLNSVLLGGALELIYETPLRGDMNLRAQVRYNELVALVTGASSSALQGQWQLRRGKRVRNPHRPDRLAHCHQRRALAGVRQGYVASGNQSQPAGVQRVRRARRGTADHRAGRDPWCARSDSTRLCHCGSGRHRLAGQRRSELLIETRYTGAPNPSSPNSSPLTPLFGSPLPRRRRLPCACTPSCSMQRFAATGALDIRGPVAEIVGKVRSSQNGSDHRRPSILRPGSSPPVRSTCDGAPTPREIKLTAHRTPSPPLPFLADLERDTAQARADIRGLLDLGREAWRYATRCLSRDALDRRSTLGRSALRQGRGRCSTRWKI